VTEHELAWLEQGLTRRLKVRFHASHLWLALDEERAEARLVARHAGALSFELDRVPTTASVRRQGDAFSVLIDGRTFELRRLDAAARRPGAELDPAGLKAPVHGRVLDVLVKAPARVKRGQVLMLLECMKLEYRVTAPADGIVEKLHFAAGDVVEEGAPLLAFTPAAESSFAAPPPLPSS
jgi:3-methylcrotonyl-CoA carboxylase alpha subunit